MSDFEILQQLCETADELSKKYISSSSPDFKAWKTRADRLLIRRFGKDSYEFKSFNKISTRCLSSPPVRPTRLSLKPVRTACAVQKLCWRHTLMSFQTKGKPDRLQMLEIIRRYLSFMVTTESLEKGSRESSKGRA